ncbi:NAD-dependent epimerase/dehydratase family protein [Paenibacillus cremeus]|uniref:NAD-dependent epimerase/dehydratase family protein n=2 Tax=Paenibacillus cremeus TaxID=2163881 RepID=A0A559K416_9BACL|nr:NAD-dependent epimerase/dehydratase family protein [Paenibacillus cremeus]
MVTGKIAVVAGATGLIGSELVRMLESDPAYARVIVLVRRKVDWGVQSRVETVVVDFDRLEEALEAVPVGGAHVFCALGTTIRKAGSQEAFRQVDYAYPLALGRAAAKAGAEQFLIVSAMGANAESGIFYNRVKGEVEEGLRQLGLRGLHLFRPSLLLGERQEFRLGERIGAVVSRGLAFLLVGGWRKYRPIAAAKVAKAMLQTAAAGREGDFVYESDVIEQTAGGSV